MLYGLIALALLLVWLGWRAGRRPPPRPAIRRPLAAPEAALPPQLDATGESRAPPATGDLADVPTELVELEWRRAEGLPDAQRDALLAELRAIPQPPRALQQLASPEFLASASSTELAKLVMAEPQVAAKVLATANSAFYGLRKPVDGIGHAITFLGLNTVRTISMKYMLDGAFAAANPDSARLLEANWQAGTLASELCSRLSQSLRMHDHGSLVTLVVLSFIGHLASVALLPAEIAQRLAGAGFIERNREVQQRLGLPPAELGTLLMREWDLPPAIVDDVRTIDRVLITPASAVDPHDGQRRALCYLCARLGERLARGDLRELAAFDPTEDPTHELVMLRSYLRQPPLERVTEQLHAPALAMGLAPMLAALHGQR